MAILWGLSHFGSLEMWVMICTGLDPFIQTLSSLFHRHASAVPPNYARQFHSGDIILESTVKDCIIQAEKLLQNFKDWLITNGGK